MVKKIKDEWAPLSAGFMITSILGFLISIMFIMDLSSTWGFTFTFMFLIMFFASIISMTKAEPIPDHMNHLAIHEPEKAHHPFLKKKTPKKEKNKTKWYEPIFILYLVGWIYYITHYFLGTINYTPMNLAIGYLAFTVFFTIYFLVHIFSHETLRGWEQVMFAIIIILTAGYGTYIFPISGIGLLLYYIHIKITQEK